jgi:hypothetical protein
VSEMGECVVYPAVYKPRVKTGLAAGKRELAREIVAKLLRILLLLVV